MTRRPKVKTGRRRSALDGDSVGWWCPLDIVCSMCRSLWLTSSVGQSGSDCMRTHAKEGGISED